jgi:hypothetical protein
MSTITKMVTVCGLRIFRVAQLRTVHQATRSNGAEIGHALLVLGQGKQHYAYSPIASGKLARAIGALMTNKAS